MSKSLIGDHVLAEMTEGQAVDSAPESETPIVETQAGINDLVLENPERASPNPLGHDRPLIQNPPLKSHLDNSSADPSIVSDEVGKKHHVATWAQKKPNDRAPAPVVKQRFGLPEGFVPRWQRFERSILLELNIYRLPNGSEFIPCRPSGTLGGHQHMYALLTTDQYLTHKRGSVYIRNDGRIFDYSVDSQIPGGDIFDTGYKLYDLERTGRYAPIPKKTRRRKGQQANTGKGKKKSKQSRHRLAAAAR